MADNYAATAGSGLTFSADDISGVLHPRIKIQTGADGVAVDVVNGQAAMADSLPVAIANNQSAIPVSVASSAIVDGADVTQGAKADNAVDTTMDTTPLTIVAILKSIQNRLYTLVHSGMAVTGSFYPATQPVSVASAQVASGAIASGAMVAGSQVDGHSATLGLTTTDAAASSVVEDTTAKTAMGLFKGIKNLLKLINDKLVSGTIIGKVQIDQTTPGTTNGVSLQPTTSGGSALYRNLDLGSTGVLATSAAAHQLYGYYLYNNATSVRYVKIYDKGSAPSSSDTPVMTIGLPASAAANLAMPNGIAFANGIGARATTGVADADTGAPSTNDVIVNIWFK